MKSVIAGILAGTIALGATSAQAGDRDQDLLVSILAGAVVYQILDNNNDRRVEHYPQQPVYRGHDRRVDHRPGRNTVCYQEVIRHDGRHATVIDRNCRGRVVDSRYIHRGH